MKRGRQVRLFSDPPPRTLPTLKIQVEHYYFSSLKCMRMEQEFLERGEGGFLYSSKGRFPPSTNMGTCQTDIRRIITMFPPKLSVRPFQMGSADPLQPPLATAFVWVSAWWVLMSDGRCQGLVGRFGLVCGPPFVCVTPDAIVCDFVCIFVVFSSYSGLVRLKT